MAIHVQDAEADWLVRDFARRRGIGLTEAIKTAVREASQLEKSAGDALAEKIEPILVEIRKNRTPTFQEDDKRFMDEMWGEPD